LYVLGGVVKTAMMTTTTTLGSTNVIGTTHLSITKSHVVKLSGITGIAAGTGDTNPNLIHADDIILF